MIIDRKRLYNKSGIYCIENIINGKKYIGSSSFLYDRLIHHVSELRKGIHNNKYLLNSFNKYGESNFIYYILEYVEIKLLKEREQFYVDMFGNGNRNKLYNICNDVIRNTPSIETREKISKTLKLKKIRPPSQLGKTHLGRSFTKKQKEEMRIKLIKYYKNNVVSDITREKISKKLIGRKHSIEVKILLSKIAKKQNRKPPVVCIPVYQYDLNGNFLRKYNSRVEAKKITGINTSDISACVKGRQKTAHGYIWRNI
jgi:group I intron endonuclease